MSKLLADILCQAARAFGSRSAIVEASRRISYTDLDLRSSEIAGALQRIGIHPGERIGIFRRKSIETIAAVYGVLKAGCAYVPIDTKTGSGRLDTILRDADVPLVITEPSLAPKLELLIPRHSYECIAGTDPDCDLLMICDCAHSDRRLKNPIEAHGASGAAYVLYTSGSTGMPKGVEHTNSSAIAFASWAADHFNIDSSDRLSCHAPLHFDLTTFDLFAALVKGACVVLIPDEFVMFPQRVAGLIVDEKITVWYSVPFALMQLVDRGSLGTRNLSALREIIFAGERYPPISLRQLAAIVPHARLTNLFGPTETNVCTYHHLTVEDIASDEFCPIGRPCPYASLRIVDPMGKEVSPGEPGELLVGGSSVMRGYLNKPDLNSKVFVRSVDGASFFRTGDLVSSLETRPLRFHGRFDRQVKLRGFRIELEEIETALLRCGGITGAAVWIAREEEGFHQILAAVETDRATDVTEHSIISQLARSLTPASVPSRVLILHGMPRMANGKIDYLALTAHAESRLSKSSEAAYYD